MCAFMVVFKTHVFADSDTLPLSSAASLLSWACSRSTDSLSIVLKKILQWEREVTLFQNHTPPSREDRAPQNYVEYFLEATRFVNLPETV